MTKDETIKAIEVMQAFVDGKTIQCRSPANRIMEWGGVYPEPAWNWSMSEYRIKPEPRIIFVNEYINGAMFIHNDLRSAEKEKRSLIEPKARTIKFTEVIE